MAEDEILIRIDRHLEVTNRHMAQGNEYMARGNEYMARGNVLMERVMDVMADVKDTIADARVVMADVKIELANNRESHQDLRQFIRDITRRNEVVHQGVVAELRDLRAETQAQTAAIYKVLDRLPPAA